MTKTACLTIPLVLLILPTAGCEEEDKDERLARMAGESTRRQAEQNKELSQLNREVAAGTKRLVEADSRSREKLVDLQRDIQEQQAQIGAQRDRLEADRKELARERRREPILAAVLDRLGGLLICALPLVLCWYLLDRLRRPDQELPLDEILIEEITSDRPKLLSPPARIISSPEQAALPDGSNERSAGSG